MSQLTPVISDFSRGELSPRMAGRSDRKEFFQGAATVENFIILPEGGAERRPGTRYFGTVQTTTKTSRLISFVVSESVYYVLEFYDGGIRVIKPSTPEFLTDKYTLTLDVAPGTDWAAGALITGGSSGTTAYVLKKNSGTSWVISEPSGAWTDGEILTADDVDGNAIAANQGAGYPTSAASTVTSIVQAPSGAAFYAESELNSIKYVQIAEQMVFAWSTKTPKILTYLDETGWIWQDINITIPAWVAADNLSIRRWYGGGIRFQNQADQAIEPQYKVGQIVLYSGSYYRCIADVTDDTVPSSDTDHWIVMSSSPTTNPFTGTGNYPSSVGFMNGRLMFAGTANKPVTGWASAVGDYQLFVIGPNDGDAWSFDFLSDRQDKIQWIAAREYLVFGTTGGEWVVQGGQNGITPTAVNAKRMTTFGSNSVQGKLVNENIVFIQKGGRKIREYVYVNASQAYQAADLTSLSEHITEGGITEFLFQSDPDPIVWFIRGDGKLIGLTYDKAAGVLGWHRHVTDGTVESIAVVPNGEEEQLWVIVARTINGSATRYIEYFEDRSHSVQRDYFHVDCGITLDGGATKSLTAATAANPVQVTVTAHGLVNNDYVRITDVTGMTELEGRVFKITKIDADNFTLNLEDGTGRTAATAGTVEQVYDTVTGLSHLEGETVDVQIDGAPSAQKTVVSGSITLTTGSYGNTIHVGLPYVSDLKTMNILAAYPSAKKGTLSELRARFINTLGGKMGYDFDHLENISYQSTTVPLGEAPPLFTGTKLVGAPTQFEEDLRACIRQDSPAPMTVAVILPGVFANKGVA